jgi:alpha-D-ribose 1-methylphosphonate 5-triphosphate synthase subunit PhnI
MVVANANKPRKLVVAVAVAQLGATKCQMAKGPKGYKAKGPKKTKG